MSTGDERAEGLDPVIRRIAFFADMMLTASPDMDFVAVKDRVVAVMQEVGRAGLDSVTDEDHAVLVLSSLFLRDRMIAQSGSVEAADTIMEAFREVWDTIQ